MINGSIAKETIDLAKIHKELMRLLMGSKNSGKKPKYDAINVMDFVRKLDKDHAGFENAYGVLSEFAHPNRDGTYALYADLNRNEYYTDFRKNSHHCESIMVYALKTLNISLFIFIEGYEVINSVFSKFTELCERALEGQNTHAS